MMQSFHVATINEASRPCNNRASRSTSNKRLEPAAVIGVLSLAILVGCTLLAEKGHNDPPSTTQLAEPEVDPASWGVSKLLRMVFWLFYLSISAVFSLLFNILPRPSSKPQTSAAHSRRSSGLSSSQAPAQVDEAVPISDRIMEWFLGRVFDYNMSDVANETTLSPMIIRRIVDMIMFMRLLACIPGSRPFADKQLGWAERLLLFVPLLMDDWNDSKTFATAVIKSAWRQVRYELIDMFVENILISTAMNRLAGVIESPVLNQLMEVVGL